ncbi:MAG: hypothetical protein M3O50_00825, partial [Myxococcota bacterium]|nr:hypothetical protein [Myxococcota bacterium]
VGLRGFVYLAVGASRYPFARFVVVDSLVGAFEVTALFAMGFALGEMRSQVGARIDLVAAALLIATLVGPLVIRWFVDRSTPLDATHPPA